MAKAIAVAGDQPAWKSKWQELIEFLKETRREMRKVVWPGRTEVETTTFVVLICVFFFAAFFYAVDKVIGTAIESMLAKLIAG